MKNGEDKLDISAIIQSPGNSLEEIKNVEFLVTNKYNLDRQQDFW